MSDCDVCWKSIKKLENVAIANALQHESTLAMPILFRFNYDTMPSLSRWTYPLLYYRVFAADTLLYAVNLTFDPVTLTFDLEHLQLWNSIPNLYAIEQSVAELLHFQYLT